MNIDVKHKILFVSCFLLGIAGLVISWLQSEELGKAGSIILLLLAQRFAPMSHAK
jgi:hypothetical protein